MTRRTLLVSAAAFAACPEDSVPLDFENLPASAHAVAKDLDLGPGKWPAYREHQRSTLAKRIDEGSAEHVTYYVLQSRRFTQQPPIDPVRLAASKPAKMPVAVTQRFDDFAAKSTGDQRHQIIRDLFQSLNWTAEACFAHTMQFLNDRSSSQKEARDALYQRRGLSADTTPEQTLVIDRALAFIKRRGRALLIGPGLDLTRREGFSDDLPLRAYQVERLMKEELDCVDVRPEVIAYLKTKPVCAMELDISTTAPSSSRYALALATNVLLYLDDRALFAAMAGVVRSLAPGGHFVHNDVRFASKVFGEVLGMPAIHFEPVSLGRRNGVELMDRVVIHRRL